MAVNSNDVLQVIDFQTYLGRQILNVYYYRYIIITPAVDPVYDSFYAAFKAAVLDNVKLIQLTSLTHTTVQVTNVTNGVDIRSYTVNETGNITSGSGNNLPSFVSAGFIYRRSSLTTRNGYKRIGGLSESFMDGNTFTFPTGAQTAIQNGMALTLQLGLLDAFEPVIYRPATLVDPAVVNSVGVVQFTQVGTQNTRKD